MDRVVSAVNPLCRCGEKKNHGDTTKAQRTRSAGDPPTLYELRRTRGACGPYFRQAFAHTRERLFGLLLII